MVLKSYLYSVKKDESLAEGVDIAKEIVIDEE